MIRRVSGLVLIALLAAVPASADTGRDRGQARDNGAASSSTRKRAIWTVVGAGAGFAAGVYLGFAKFDDATYAERKIWTTAIVGAAAGGVAGALLSRNTRRGVPVTRAPRAPEIPNISWSEALRGPTARTFAR
jgi:hypothetical protein